MFIRSILISGLEVDIIIIPVSCRRKLVHQKSKSHSTAEHRESDARVHALNQDSVLKSHGRMEINGHR